MKPRRPAAPQASLPAPPVIFKAGEHSLSIVYVTDGRWTASVDGGPASQTYRTQAEAWEAGVRAAYELDRPRRP